MMRKVLHRIPPSKKFPRKKVADQNSGTMTQEFRGHTTDIGCRLHLARGNSLLGLGWSGSTSACSRAAATGSRSLFAPATPQPPSASPQPASLRRALRSY